MTLTVQFVAHPKLVRQVDNARNDHIVAAVDGKPEGIDIDIGGCANVSSMFFAGLLLLRDTYKPMPVRLIKVCDRIYRTLQVMCMDNLFQIELDSDQASKKLDRLLRDAVAAAWN